jgi:hypothetical protein
MTLAIGYDEEMVGSGHPTKADTLNRLFMGGSAPVLRDTDGKVLAGLYKKQNAAPAPAAGELALYAAEEDGSLALFARRADGGQTRLA